MIFIYGTCTRTIATKLLTHVICRHCGEPQSVYGSVVSPYVHFFRFPIFPLQKKGYSVCTHCKQALDEPGMPVNYREAVSLLKSEAKTPIWEYAGLALAATGIIIPVIIRLAAYMGLP